MACRRYSTRETRFRDGIGVEGDMDVEAARMVEEYINHGSISEVNIPSSMRQKILKAYKDGERVGIFDDSRIEIFNLMAKVDNNYIQNILPLYSTEVLLT